MAQAAAKKKQVLKRLGTSGPSRLREIAKELRVSDNEAREILWALVQKRKVALTTEGTFRAVS